MREWKTPMKVVHVQQFIGLCSYYRKFIKDFAEIAAPLYNLLKKDVKWHWSAESETAFRQLKLYLTSEPIIRSVNNKLSFILYTDASSVAIGAILSQKDELGYEYVCYYASRLLKGGGKEIWH